MPNHTQSAREAKKGIANDPQASSSYSLKEKEKRQKKKEKVDKLASDVTYYGAGAMAILGGGALGGIPSKGKKVKSPSKMMKDYFIDQLADAAGKKRKIIITISVDV